MTDLRMQDLTPAESVVLLSPDRYDKRLPRIAVLSLVIRGFLLAEATDDSLTIREGPRFGERDALSDHEQSFLEALDGQESLPLREFVKSVRDALGFGLSFEHSLFPRVREDLKRKGLVQEEYVQVLGLIPSVRISRTEAGERICGELQGRLALGAQRLPRWLAEDPEQARTFVLSCGSNVLLIAGLTPATSLACQQILTSTHLDSGDGLLSGAHAWTALDSITDPLWGGHSFDFGDFGGDGGGGDGD